MVCHEIVVHRTFSGFCKKNWQLFGVGVDEIVGYGCCGCLFQACVYVFDMLVIVVV